MEERRERYRGSLQSAGDIVTIPAMFSSDPTARVCEYESGQGPTAAALVTFSHAALAVRA